MKAMKKHIFIISLVLIVVYSGLSVIGGTFNCFAWNEALALLFLVVALIVISFGTLIIKIWEP